MVSYGWQQSRELHSILQALSAMNPDGSYCRFEGGGVLFTVLCYRTDHSISIYWPLKYCGICMSQGYLEWLLSLNGYISHAGRFRRWLYNFHCTGDLGRHPWWPSGTIHPEPETSRTVLQQCFLRYYLLSHLEHQFPWWSLDCNLS